MILPSGPRRIRKESRLPDEAVILIVRGAAFWPTVILQASAGLVWSMVPVTEVLPVIVVGAAILAAKGVKSMERFGPPGSIVICSGLVMMKLATYCCVGLSVPLSGCSVSPLTLIVTVKLTSPPPLAAGGDTRVGVGGTVTACVAAAVP